MAGVQRLCERAERFLKAGRHRSRNPQSDLRLRAVELQNAACRGRGREGSAGPGRVPEFVVGRIDGRSQADHHLISDDNPRQEFPAAAGILRHGQGSRNADGPGMSHGQGVAVIKLRDMADRTVGESRRRNGHLHASADQRGLRNPSGLLHEVRYDKGGLVPDSRQGAADPVQHPVLGLGPDIRRQGFVTKAGDKPGQEMLRILMLGRSRHCSTSSDRKTLPLPLTDIAPRTTDATARTRKAAARGFCTKIRGLP